ncbi:hypothetical protein B0H14DRAFT_3041568, partial [Mycena olivaceomarginata]
MHARALLRMKRGERRFRSRLLTVRADVLLPFLLLCVLSAATLLGNSDSTTPSAEHISTNRSGSTAFTSFQTLSPRSRGATRRGAIDR